MDSPPRPNTPTSIAQEEHPIEIESLPIPVLARNNPPHMEDFPENYPAPLLSLCTSREFLHHYAMHHFLNHNSLLISQNYQPTSRLQFFTHAPAHLESCTYCYCKHAHHNHYLQKRCSCVAETVLEHTFHDYFSVTTYCITCKHRALYSCPILLLELAIFQDQVFDD